MDEFFHQKNNDISRSGENNSQLMNILKDNLFSILFVRELIKTSLLQTIRSSLQQQRPQTCRYQTICTNTVCRPKYLSAIPAPTVIPLCTESKSCQQRYLVLAFQWVKYHNLLCATTPPQIWSSTLSLDRNFNSN